MSKAAPAARTRARNLAFPAAIALACALATACLGLSACSGGGNADPTELVPVLSTEVTGLEKKLVAESYKGSVSATVTVSPAYGRDVQLERYDAGKKSWQVEQTLQADDAEASTLTFDFGDGWRQHGSSRWRIVAPTAPNAGPEHETLGEASATTRVVNDFLSCKAALVMDAGDGKVVYEHRGTKRKKIASMTKMLSAIVLVENREATDPVKITKKAWQTAYSFGFSKGDVLTAEQALYGMMLPSANDAAAAVAYEVGGTFEGFAEMMNGKAAEIGCTDSAFVTPHGLDAEGAHSTALDVARIGRYIMTSDSCQLVRDAARTQTYSFTVKTKKKVKAKAGDGKKAKKTTKTVEHAYKLESTNRLLKSKKLNALGLKTGYTDGAGNCFCGAFDIDGRTYITVVIDAPSSEKRWADTKRLVKFAKYARESQLNPYEVQ